MVTVTCHRYDLDGDEFAEETVSARHWQHSNVLTADVSALTRDKRPTVIAQGWKLVHGDVFRSPKHSNLLSVLVGSGVQLGPSFFIIPLPPTVAAVAARAHSRCQKHTPHPQLPVNPNVAAVACPPACMRW